MRRLTEPCAFKHKIECATALSLVQLVTRQAALFFLPCIRDWAIRLGDNTFCLAQTYLGRLATTKNDVLINVRKVMMKRYTDLWLILLALLALALSACSLKFEPNPDGSTRMEITLDEAAMQTKIQQSIKDPQVEDFHVELRDGYIEVSGTRQNVQTGNLDSLRYRLDLGAADGHLTAVISQVVINDFPLQPDWLEPWNENIANNLAASGQNDPNSSFEQIVITEDDVLMVWRIEPK